MRISGIAVLVIVAGLARWANAEPVDLSKPFQVDKDTICLFHLEDVAGREVKDAVPGGKSGNVQVPSTAEGKFAGALNCNGDNGWVDVTGLAKMECRSPVLDNSNVGQDTPIRLLLHRVSSQKTIFAAATTRPTSASGPLTLFT